MSIGKGSLAIAQAGLLRDMAATTHPDYYTKVEIICQDAARRGDLEQTNPNSSPNKMSNRIHSWLNFLFHILPPQ